MRKAMVCMILVVTMMFSMTIGSFADSNYMDDAKDIVLQLVKLGRQFSDAAEHWASKYIARLYDLGTMNGFPDGTFKPDNSIKAGEFTKILVSSLGYKDLGNSSEGHWSTNYINKAEDLELIKSGELADLDKEINRGEMARMIIRALDEDMPGNINEYAKQIKDYNDIPSKYKDFVLKAYVKGIITGYNDGTFKYDRSATRAEASTMIMRLLDEEEREIPELKVVDERSDEATEMIINGKVITSENPDGVIAHAIKGKEIMSKGDGLLDVTNSSDTIYLNYYSDKEIDLNNPLNALKMTMDYRIHYGSKVKHSMESSYKIIFYNLPKDLEVLKFTREIIKDLYPKSHNEVIKKVEEIINNKKEDINLEYKNKTYIYDERKLIVWTNKGNEQIAFWITTKE